jgi:hypothetical protein
MKYQVKPLRDAGLEAKWSKTSAGAPIIVARNPKATLAHQREKWWFVDARMFADMKTEGVLEAFDSHTFIADVFSVPI